MRIRRTRCARSKAHDTRTRNSCELTRARNLYVCHTDLQQDISRASFSHQIERAFYFVQVSRVSVMDFSVATSAPVFIWATTNKGTSASVENIHIYRQSMKLTWRSPVSISDSTHGVMFRDGRWAVWTVRWVDAISLMVCIHNRGSLPTAKWRTKSILACCPDSNERFDGFHLATYKPTGATVWISVSNAVVLLLWIFSQQRHYF